jgi:lipoprotein-releasing system ATP-binding protein
MKANVIEAQQLQKAYLQGEKRIEVLRKLDLKVEEGECIALLGASGSGKSTLLHLLGLLDRADSGELTVLGSRVLNLTESQRAEFRLKNLGFVFQFHHLIPELTSLENVALPAALRGERREKRAAELLDWMGLSARLKAHPYQLSGGEQQRVALARALINEPRVLLTDEATGNLDRERANEVLEVLFKANRDLGTTLLSVTHDSELASRYRRILSLRDGHIEDRII